MSHKSAKHDCENMKCWADVEQTAGGRGPVAHYINDEGQIAWIAQHAEVSEEIVKAVLDLQFDYDTQRLAQDGERTLGIPARLQIGFRGGT